MMVRLVLLLLLSMCWSAPVSGEAPACTAASSGTVACIAERSCLCQFERGGTTTDQSSGYRWNCGVLRPYCSRPPEVKPTERSIDELNLLVRPPTFRPHPRPPLRPLGGMAG